MWKPARGGRRVRLVRVILGAPGGDDEGLTVERPVQGLADLDLRHPARVDVDVVHGQGRGRPGAGLQAGIGPYLLDLRRGHGRGGDGVLVVTPVGDQPVGLLLAATAVEVHNDAVEVLVADRVRPRLPVRVLRQDQRAGLAVTVHHVRTGGHELGFVARARVPGPRHRCAGRQGHEERPLGVGVAQGEPDGPVVRDRHARRVAGVGPGYPRGGSSRSCTSCGPCWP